MLIDSHCHLDFESLSADLGGVLERVIRLRIEEEEIGDDEQRAHHARAHAAAERREDDEHEQDRRRVRHVPRRQRLDREIDEDGEDDEQRALVIERAAIGDSAKPIASPASVSASPRLPKKSTISPDVAPNAIRTPISLVRCITA